MEGVRDMAKAKMAEKFGDTDAQRVIEVLNQAGDKARKNFEATLPHRAKTVLGVLTRKGRAK
jgi:hypothetical protein